MANEDFEEAIREQQLREIRLAIGKCSAETASEEVTAIVRRIVAASPGEVVTDRLLKSLAQQTGDSLDGLRRQFTTDQKTRKKSGAISIEDEQRIVADFNKTFAVVNEGGKIWVMCRRADPALARLCLERISFADFRKMFANQFAGKQKAADLWLSHPDRNQFLGGVTFDPTESEPEGYLNLWKGFSVIPAPGDWSLMRAHILDVVCSANKEHNNYLLNWAARTVQHPENRGETAVVLRGDEGTGKGIFGRWMASLFGQHGMQITSPVHLVGRFNSHLRDCVLLFADEAFFAGDKQHESVLKGIITEPTLVIEGKGQNAVIAPNMLHVIMASNADWVVPASLGARRYFVLDVLDTKRGDIAYFSAIERQMQNGGAAAMLHDLLNRDLSGFEVRNVPQTDALARQKALSLDSLDRWWLSVLERGFVWRSRHGVAEFNEWMEFCSTELLNRSYLQWCGDNRVQRPMTRVQLGVRMTEIYQRNRPDRQEIIGEVETATKTAGDLSSSFIAEDLIVKADRPHGYSVNALDAARTQFTAIRGIGGEWTAQP